MCDITTSCSVIKSVVVTKVCCFPSNKSWMNRRIKALFNGRKWALMAGGQWRSLKEVQREIRRAEVCYKNRIQGNLQQNITEGMFFTSAHYTFLCWTYTLIHLKIYRIVLLLYHSTNLVGCVDIVLQTLGSRDQMWPGVWGRLGHIVCQGNKSQCFWNLSSWPAISLEPACFSFPSPSGAATH